MRRSLYDILVEEISTSIAGMMDVQPINVVGYKKEHKGKSKKAQLQYPYTKIRNNKNE